jgi:hypothetical protein
LIPTLHWSLPSCEKLVYTYCIDVVNLTFSFNKTHVFFSFILVSYLHIQIARSGHCVCKCNPFYLGRLFLKELSRSKWHIKEGKIADISLAWKPNLVTPMTTLAYRGGTTPMLLISSDPPSAWSISMFHLKMIHGGSSWITVYLRGILLNFFSFLWITDHCGFENHKYSFLIHGYVANRLLKRWLVTSM